MRPKQRPVLRKLFSLVSIHSPPDKILLYLWNKNFLTQIYRNIYGHLLSKCFKNAVIERPETAPCKCFFGHQTAKSLQFVKSERFLIVLPEHFMFNIKWVEICKISEIFRAKYIVKRVIIFSSFCWHWENLKSKKNFDDVHWNLWTNNRKFAWNNTFKKRITNMRFWIIYILVWISFLWEIALGYFSQCFFQLSSLAKHGGLHPIFLFSLPTPFLLSFPLPTVKKLPTTLRMVLWILHGSKFRKIPFYMFWDKYRKWKFHL